MVSSILFRRLRFVGDGGGWGGVYRSLGASAGNVRGVRGPGFGAMCPAGRCQGNCVSYCFKRFLAGEFRLMCGTCWGMVLGAFGLAVLRRETRCFCLMRALEMFAGSEGHVPAGRAPRMDVALFRGSTQLEWPIIYCVDRVKLHFQCFKGERFRQRAVVSGVCTLHSCSSLCEGGSLQH